MKWTQALAVCLMVLLPGELVMSGYQPIRSQTVAVNFNGKSTADTYRTETWCCPKSSAPRSEPLNEGFINDR